jgi:hypothetical protein
VRGLLMNFGLYSITTLAYYTSLTLLPFYLPGIHEEPSFFGS